jgi:hypothetical protein
MKRNRLALIVGAATIAGTLLGGTAYVYAQGMGPGWGYGMGPGMGRMGSPEGESGAYGGWGPGYGMGPGMGMMGMGRGMMGMGGMGGMMGPGMMGMGGMMGPGMGMGPGMTRGWGAQDCPWASGDPGRLLGKDDVTKMLERQLAMHGNDRLKVGKIEEKDDKTIVAEIVTKDNSLVDKFSIDRRTGWRTRIK